MIALAVVLHNTLCLFVWRAFRGETTALFCIAGSPLGPATLLRHLNNLMRLPVRGPRRDVSTCWSALTVATGYLLCRVGPQLHPVGDAYRCRARTLAAACTDLQRLIWSLDFLSISQGQTDPTNVDDTDLDCDQGRGQGSLIFRGIDGIDLKGLCTRNPLNAAATTGSCATGDQARLTTPAPRRTIFGTSSITEGAQDGSICRS